MVDVGQVAAVRPMGVVDAVLLLVGVEVAAGGGKVGGVAEGFGVDAWTACSPGARTLEADFDGELRLVLLEGGSASVLAGAGFEVDGDGWGFVCGEGGNADEAEGESGEGDAHGRDSPVSVLGKNTADFSCAETGNGIKRNEGVTCVVRTAGAGLGTGDDGCCVRHTPPYPICVQSTFE